jgi:hypothetical protein
MCVLPSNMEFGWLVQDHAPEITHDQQVEQYFKSTFCPVISGDSQVIMRLLSQACTCVHVYACMWGLGGRPAGQEPTCVESILLSVVHRNGMYLLSFYVVLDVDFSCCCCC